MGNLYYKKILVNLNNFYFIILTNYFLINYITINYCYRGNSTQYTFCNQLCQANHNTFVNK